MISMETSPFRAAPAPVEEKSALRTFTPRLTPRVNDLLRNAYRYRGDLSAQIIEALATQDLRKIRVENFVTGKAAAGAKAAPLDRPTIPTSIRIEAALLTRVQAIAEERQVTTNAMVNWAVRALLGDR